MRFAAVLAALVPVLAVSAQNTIVVQVGANGTLTYTPNSVTANAGDTIQFQFLSKNHTVTQSSFAAPCQNLTTPTQGIDSGFMPVTNSSNGLVPAWSFTVNNASAPLWFYCRQTGHCQQGMVFAVNPTAAKSFSAFQAAAMGQTANSSATPTSGSTSPIATGSSSTTPSAAGTTSSSGAMHMGSSAAGLITAFGLVASFVF